jgi:uncharacterized protein
MLNRLPEIIEPLHLADKRGELKGEIAVSNLERIADLLYSDEGSVTVELFFGREGRLATVDGRIHTVLQLECQNCLQALEWTVDSAVKLGIVSSIEQANRLDERYEPLLVEAETMHLSDLIEDELLLCLPSYPKHQHSCLAEQPSNNNTQLAEPAPKSASENPFSILATLKKNTGDL